MLKLFLTRLTSLFATKTVDGILASHIKMADALDSLQAKLLKAAQAKEAEADKLKAEAAAADAEAVKAHEAAGRLRALVTGL